MPKQEKPNQDLTGEEILDAVAGEGETSKEAKAASDTSSKAPSSKKKKSAKSKKKKSAEAEAPKADEPEEAQAEEDEPEADEDEPEAAEEADEPAEDEPETAEEADESEDDDEAEDSEEGDDEEEDEEPAPAPVKKSAAPKKKSAEKSAEKSEAPKKKSAEKDAPSLKKKGAEKDAPSLKKKGAEKDAPSLKKKSAEKPARPKVDLDNLTDETAPGAFEPPAFDPWPTDKDHTSAKQILLPPTGKVRDIDLGEDERVKRNTVLNLMLLLLIGAAVAAGTWQFMKISSPEALAAKRAEREELEQKHLAEQLAKKKKYGLMRIESKPAQAELWLNGERQVNKNEATGEEVIVKTPVNLHDLDIAQAYSIKLVLPGYEPYEFNVGEHLWAKESASGDFKFFRLAELEPTACDYWFLYDSKQKKEVQFKEKEECTAHFDAALAKQISVTECSCKLPAEFDKKPEEAPQK